MGLRRPHRRPPHAWLHKKKPSKLTLTSVPNVPSMLRTRGPPPCMAPKSSSPHRLTNPNHSTPAVSPGFNNYWHSLVLRSRHQQHPTRCSRSPICGPIQRDGSHIPSHHPALKLLCHSSQCHHTVYCQQHVIEGCSFMCCTKCVWIITDLIL